MKRCKLSWLGAGLAFVLLANFALAQNNDDDRKGRGRDRGERGQNSRQADQYPQNRRQSQNPYQNRQRDDVNRGQQKDSLSDRDSRQRQPRTSNTDSQFNERRGGANNRQDDLKKNDNSTRPKDLDTRQKNTPGRDRDINSRDQSGKQNQPRQATKEPVRNVPTPKLTTKEIRGGSEKVTASGQVREKTLKKSDGEHTQYMGATGRVQREIVRKPDGTEQATHYGTNGKVERTVLTKKDGTKEVANVRYDRSGKERATETVRVDARGREVSKTVVIKNTTVIVKNTTIVRNRTIVRNYDRARFGFVYRPVYVVHAPVFVSWYDPYWYTPHGVLIAHPFHFYWGWDRYDWYRWHHRYWVTYDVYPAPCYWLTDWMIAGYVADRYADAVTAEQAREDARAAREDAERARDAAERAREDAEIAEANAARAEAEARAAKAEARAKRLEAEQSSIGSRSDQPNPNATPIDPQTKEDLRKQVEQEIADKKAYAEATASGKNLPPPDLTKALADPKHIYPVSSPLSVVSAVDQSPAGVLTEGDLLRVEPGQESILKDADENTLITMRVMTSKGDDGEAKAGTLVSVSLKSLQEFDSEFKAKLDLGLAEADKNKDEFRSGAVQTRNGSWYAATKLS